METTMRSAFAALYSAAVYIFFLVTFTYAILWVERIFVPTTIDSGVPGDLVTSLVINGALLGLFAVQHTIMARPGFKRWWTKIIPAEMERSTFVLAATLALALLLWQWRPLPDLVWSVDEPMLATAIIAVSWSGWALLLLSTFLISHFHLFGLSQGWAKILKIKEGDGPFVTPLFYKWIRHPLYLGFILAFWAAPQMSVGHLFFAIMTTGYIFVGIWFEERDLVAHFGERYLQYRRQVGMLIPKFGTKRDGEKTHTL
jgi:protein-S-isoprenylcysteine O-methyltransferase Ste14